MSIENQNAGSTGQAGAANDAAGARGDAPSASPAQVVMTSDKLKDRLAEERATARRELLKRFGAEKDSDVEAKLKRLGELEDAGRSELEKRDARIKELERDLEPTATRAKRYEERLRAVAEQRLAALPERARDSIVRRAGDDLERRLELLELLDEVGTNSATPNDRGGAGSAPPPGQPAPATTAAGSPPPRPIAAKTKWDEYQDVLRAHGDVAGSIFYASNQHEIERSRPADT